MGERDPIKLLRDIDCWTFQLWKADYKRNPWGETRADMRAEAQRQRLLWALFGKESDERPESFYPYWQAPMTPEEFAEWEKKMREADANLVYDPATGGYRWKDET